MDKRSFSGIHKKERREIAINRRMKPPSVFALVRRGGAAAVAAGCFPAKIRPLPPQLKLLKSSCAISTFILAKL